MIINLEVPEGVHYKSTDSCYEGGFTRITQCNCCKAVQDYWSNNSRICKHCGGDLVEIGVGRWESTSKSWQKMV